MAKKWYPVIDYSKCKECGSCIKKCTHGVYDQKKSPTPVVINPVGCIDQCHGCGNICPVGAITYVGDNTGWNPPHGNSIKEAEACSCCIEKSDKIINVDFLYLDLNTCSRCIATDSALNEALEALNNVFKTLGYQINVNRVNISSIELAEQYQFLSSPTIRVNGKDICLNVKENNCKDCGDLCGSDVDCRVFEYQGIEYNQPPKAMIMEGVLQAIYAPKRASEETVYQLPRNLQHFFNQKENTCCNG